MRVIIFVLFSTTNTKLYLLKPLSILIKAFIIYSYLYYVSSHFFVLVFLNNVLDSLFYLLREICPYPTFYLFLYLALFHHIFHYLMHCVIRLAMQQSFLYTVSNSHL